MAEYLHLYTEDPAGSVETDLNLRGTTYQIDDGWAPATIDPRAADLDRAIVTENMTIGVLGCATAAAVQDAASALRQMLWEAQRRHELERYPHTRTFLRRYPDGGSADDYRTAEVVGGSVERVLWLGQREVQTDSAEWTGVIHAQIDHKVPRGVVEVLKNLCETPSMEYDTDSDGLADDWTEFGTAGSQTPAIVEVANDYGRYGQQLTLTGTVTTTGIKGDAIAVAAETEYHLKAWVDPSGSTRDFRVEVYDETNGAYITASRLSWTAGGSASMQSVSFDTPAGCVSVTVRAYWAEGSSSDVAVVDAIYLGLKGSYAPQAWASYYTIQNHEDGRANSTDKPWLHVADVPGDVEAIIENQITVTAGGQYSIILCGRRTDEAVWRAPLWLDIADADSLSNISLVTDANASGPASNNAGTMTPGAGLSQSIAAWNLTTDGEHVPLRGLYRVLVRLKRTAGTDDSLNFTMYQTAGDVFISDTLTATVNNAAFAMMLGQVLRFPPARPLELYTESSITVEVRFVGGGDTYTVDGIRLVPVDEALSYLPDIDSYNLANDEAVILSGDALMSVALDSSGDYYPIGTHEGLVVHLAPGMPQRLYYVIAEDDGSNDPPDWLESATAEIELAVRPRYLSL